MCHLRTTTGMPQGSLGGPKNSVFHFHVLVCRYRVKKHVSNVSHSEVKVVLYKILRYSKILEMLMSQLSDVKFIVGSISEKPFFAFFCQY